MKKLERNRGLGSDQDSAINKPETFLNTLIPLELQKLEDPQKDIPRISKSPKLMKAIELAIEKVPTEHRIHLGDARKSEALLPESVHLVLTSPPYWTLKKYRNIKDQLGHVEDYEEFLTEIDKVWSNCFNALVPGGRLVCVVGDVCLSRRKNNGRHTVIPLHASIQQHCQAIGFDNLTPIIWHKISNASYEVSGNGGFLGKPFEPNAIIKNDIEFILMLRKPGGYRRPTLAKRILSIISSQNHQKWFQQIWADIAGASTRQHPAPFPLELAERLIRMYSFVGDTVLDPFMGTATSSVGAARWGRDSVGYDIDPQYFNIAVERLRQSTGILFSKAAIKTFTDGN